MGRHPQNVPQQAAGSLKFPRNDCSLQGTELMNKVGSTLKCDLNWLSSCENWSNIATHLWDTAVFGNHSVNIKTRYVKMLELLSVEWVQAMTKYTELERSINSSCWFCVNFPLHADLKVSGEGESQPHSFLTLATDRLRGKLQTPAALTSGRAAPVLI